MFVKFWTVFRVESVLVHSGELVGLLLGQITTLWPVGYRESIAKSVAPVIRVTKVAFRHRRTDHSEAYWGFVSAKDETKRHRCMKDIANGTSDDNAKCLREE